MVAKTVQLVMRELKNKLSKNQVKRYLLHSGVDTLNTLLTMAGSKFTVGSWFVALTALPYQKKIIIKSVLSFLSL